MNEIQQFILDKASLKNILRESATAPLGGLAASISINEFGSRYGVPVDRIHRAFAAQRKRLNQE